MADLDLRTLLEGRGSGPKPGAAEEAPPEAGDPMMDSMQDFLSAVEAKDPQGMANALRTAFQAMEMEPHMEAGEMEAPEPGDQG